MSERVFDAFSTALRAEIDAVVARYQALAVAREEALREEIARLSARVAELEAAARSAADVSRAMEEQFLAEQAFAAACRGLEQSLLGEALAHAVGREIDATPAAYAALKARGLEAVLVAAFKERGRSVVQAPLLERERAALAGVAAAAGCDLLTPSSGTKFSSSTMDKAGTASEPAEEGNILECLIPGLRRAGTDGALLFPRVLVATG